MKVAVLGAGSWGTTVASQVSVNAETVLWARETEVVDAIGTTRRTRCSCLASHSPALSVPPVTSRKRSGRRRHRGRRAFAVLSVGSRAGRAIRAVRRRVVSVTKGIEPTTCLRMTEVIADVWDHDPATVAFWPDRIWPAR